MGEVGGVGGDGEGSGCWFVTSVVKGGERDSMLVGRGRI